MRGAKQKTKKKQLSPNGNKSMGGRRGRKRKNGEEESVYNDITLEKLMRC